MATVFVTGSTDGIGRQTALDLIGHGHRVVVHARSQQRAEQVRAAVPDLAGVAVGDLASLAETRAVAEAAVGLVEYDVIIHNAGLAARRSGGSPTTGSSKSGTWCSPLLPHVIGRGH